jgi:protein ImuB
MNRRSSTAITPGKWVQADLCVVRHQPEQAAPSAEPSNRTPLWLALHLTQLPLEATGAPAGHPATVIFEQRGQAHRVTVANDAASRAGIKPPMALAAARALAPHLRTLPRDRTSEQQALEKWAAEAMRWTPRVSVVEDGLLMEITGSLRLYGGLQQLILLVRNWIGAETACFQMALTPTPASAILCARAGQELCVTDRRQLASRLHGLSVEWLTLNHSQRALLERLGICKIGDLLRLPRHDLARRTGQEFVNQLDRLTGQQADPRPTYTPPLMFSQSFDLVGEIAEIEQLLPAVELLLQDLVSQLRRSGTALRRLDWALTNIRHESIEVPVYLAQPRRDLKLFLKLSRLAFESVRLMSPVTELTLRAQPLVLPLEQSDALLPGIDTQPDDPAALLDSLRNRLGHAVVQGIQPQSDHRPEKSWVYCNPGEQRPCSCLPPRPLWLLPRPTPIESNQGRPSHRGKSLHLEKQVERISSGWWDDSPVRRDYYRASNDELQAWIFRDIETGDWFLHGIF